MRRILLSALIVLGAAGFFVIAGGASNSSTSGSTYRIEIDNAFGLVNGADFKVAGVRAGTISSIDLCWAVRNSHCQHNLDALVGVKVTQSGFGSFHPDAFCQSRPQSLIGEYFIECEPGNSGPVLKSGSTIPVSRTQSTIPADLLNNVMRMPYRERFTLIINELGAAVAGRSGDLQEALRRAVPALTETDNLLNLLANDSQTLKALTSNSDAVITALANNSANVQRFITEANNTAVDTAAQQTAFQQTWQKLPGFLEQLRPTLADLSGSIATNTPVLQNLNASAGNLTRFINDLPGFANASLPSLRSLGKASVTGKSAVQAARPTIRHLNQFAKQTPELAQNLAIVGHALEDRGRAVEADPRSPSGKGYTGLEALLQYVFNQTLAINTFTNFGHQLTVDAFFDAKCSGYADAKSVATGLKNFGPSYRDCYAWYGATQPGINSVDPSNPHGCVPDPGGEPPAHPGTHPAAPIPCKLTAADVARAQRQQAKTDVNASTVPLGSSTSTAPSSVRSGGGPGINLSSTLSQALSALGIGSKGASSSSGAGLSSATGLLGGASGDPGSGGSGSSGGGGNGSQAKQLLNYLLAP